MEEQDAKVVELQKGSEVEREGIRYYGAIAGSYSYIFTPTGLGVAVQIKNNVTEEVLDLTDYDAW